ncbi:MAG: hypothetical protein IJ639_04975 [Ruminococcus sp.]|nr:hypothetical protein [Ruminococcus sp.]
MKCLKRNQKPFCYALYLRRERLGNGYRPVYGEAVAARGNISPATGSTSVEQFGNNLEYDKVIVLDDVNCPIDENTVLFVDTEPRRNADGDYLYDYKVKKVARSLNSVSIAISKVTVS